jgi:hypothetical protein
MYGQALTMPMNIVVGGGSPDLLALAVFTRRLAATASATGVALQQQAELALQRRIGGLLQVEDQARHARAFRRT